MTSPKSQPLTAPVEDYLKVIFELETAGGAASTNEIAAELGIAAASVSGMVRRLADQGLIAHQPYRGVRLTSAGRRAALRTIRRHRVIEAYLTTALHYPWDRVHEEACVGFRALPLGHRLDACLRGRQLRKRGQAVPGDRPPQ